MEKIFLRLTIKGNSLNLSQISKDISLPAEIFEKGTEVRYNFKLTTAKPRFQATNRWVYSIESQEKEDLNRILGRMYKDISPCLDKLNEYIKKHRSILDIVVYTNKPESISCYNVTLSKTSLKIISRLDIEFSLAIFDW